MPRERLEIPNPKSEMSNHGVRDSTVFEISRGGSINVGTWTDRYPDPGWYIDVHGNRDAACELWQLEDEVHVLLSLGAEIRVYDESYIDFSKV